MCLIVSEGTSKGANRRGDAEPPLLLHKLRLAEQGKSPIFIGVRWDFPL